MDVTTKKIAQLIGPEHDAAMRQAAVRVLGEVADAEKPIAAALCAALDDADPGVRLAAIQAIGKLKVAEALPKLLSRIERGGEEAQEAARSAARLGVKGAKALQDLMHKVAPGLRRYIASALGSAGTSSGDTAALEFLLDKDPGVVESAARSLIGQVPMLTTAKKQSLTEQLIHHLKDAKTGLSSGSEAAAVRVLAALGDERAEAVFWNRSSAPHAVEVRIASLQTARRHGPQARQRPTPAALCQRARIGFPRDRSDLVDPQAPVGHRENRGGLDDASFGPRRGGTPARSGEARRTRFAGARGDPGGAAWPSGSQLPRRGVASDHFDG